jgi:bacillithiol biosynthesis cysteine-adding enzyme BshC
VSTTEVACISTPEQARLNIKALPFREIPNQSRLFLDYLEEPQKISRFYGGAVQFLADPSLRAPDVLKNYTVDRQAVCDALERMNTGWGAPPEVLRNISRLREEDCVAVVSGQQAGLFSGPLYTIYKALSAVKFADCLTQRGTKAVPVFWMATEDHDFQEAATAEFIGCDCRLASVSASPHMHRDGSTVGSVVLDESINETIKRLIEVLPSSEFIPELEKLLRESYRPGFGYGDAFARMMTALVGRHGLILLDPRDSALKKLASPVYSKAAAKAGEIAEALQNRSRELEEAGYHAQVVVSADSFPLFMHTEGDVRHAIVRTESGRYAMKNSHEEFTAEELAAMAQSEPERFSPNVTLRAVVQDYLLPTVVYYGGSAEVAYFAQTSEVYRELDRPVTPILHRASMTIVESRTGRTLARFNLELKDLFEGPEKLIARVVEEHLGAEAAKGFVNAESCIQRELDGLKLQLEQVDPTLAEALETGRKKIFYQLEGLRSRFHRAQMARDQAAYRQLERAFAQLFPHKSLQERHINITSLLARHGRYVLDWIYDAINLGSPDHLVVYL